MPDDKDPENKKGPKGGVKHTPGRGHDTSSGPVKKRRFQRKAAKLRKDKKELAQKLWAEWEAMSPEQRKLLGPKAKPRLPRPKDEN